MSSADHSVRLAYPEARKALLVGAVAALTAPDDRAAGLFEVVIADAQLWPFDLTRVHLLFGERLRRSRKVTRSRHRAAAELAATAPTRQRETGPQEPLTA